MTLSDTDFLALERSASGRIVDFYDVFFLLTPEQVEQLHEDDWTNYHSYAEETEFELAYYA